MTERAHVTEARCTVCGWERSSADLRPEFVVRYARRHAAVWGHEVQVRHEKYTVFPGRERRPVPRHYRQLMGAAGRPAYPGSGRPREGT